MIKKLDNIDLKKAFEKALEENDIEVTEKNSTQNRPIYVEEEGAVYELGSNFRARKVEN